MRGEREEARRSYFHGRSVMTHKSSRLNFVKEYKI